jgi:disulfide bond formation protein DsbB
MPVSTPSSSSDGPRTDPGAEAGLGLRLARGAPLWLALGSGALLLAALAFQYLGGLDPCVLCLWQRWPHAAVVALGLVGFFALGGQRGRAAVSLVLALILIGGAGLAGFHVGVEQGWWEGTAACGGAAANGAGALSAADLRDQLLSTPVVRCDAVAWSMLGVSMAGWNGLASLALAAVGIAAAIRLRRG